MKHTLSAINNTTHRIFCIVIAVINILLKARKKSKLQKLNSVLLFWHEAKSQEYNILLKTISKKYDDIFDQLSFNVFIFGYQQHIKSYNCTCVIEIINLILIDIFKWEIH